MNHDSNSSRFDNSPLPHICWSAIFSGALVGVGLGFLLQLYGVAIGLSAYSAPSNGAMTIAIGGFLGLLVGVIVSMGTAGFVSGYLGRFHFSHWYEGVIYGFLAWVLALLLNAAMVMPLAHYASAYTQAIKPGVFTSDSSPHDIHIIPQTDTSMSKVSGKAQPNMKVTSSVLTENFWIIFILFFIGAISAGTGACCGMKCKKGPYQSTNQSNPISPNKP